MKTTCSVFAASVLALTSCSTSHHTGKTPANPQSPVTAQSKPETVLVTYHVQIGKEADLQALLFKAWDIYRSEHMVVSKPHILVQETETGGASRFVEIFTWVKAPDHAPESVKAIWGQEQALCEARNGRRGIDGGEVTLITQK